MTTQVDRLPKKYRTRRTARKAAAEIDQKYEQLTSDMPEINAVVVKSAWFGSWQVEVRTKFKSL